MPYMIEGGMEPMIDFVKSNANDLNTMLHKYGALLLREFNIHSVSEFQVVASLMCNDLFDYTYRSSPRTKLGGKIFTSTEYPCQYTIPLHNENSYSKTWPNKILFYCAIEPRNGGETPIAYSYNVYQLINNEIRDEFERKGVLYVRNYGHGFDLNWQEVFQTESKSNVEMYCQNNGIEYQWISEQILRTKQTCQAAIEHPVTKKYLWFNQAHLFHQSANEALLQQYFSEKFEPDDLPRNAFFGDGTAIEKSVIDHIREAYNKSTCMFPWRKGDVLVLDNLAVAHGRQPFSGERKIVVAMGN